MCPESSLVTSRLTYYLALRARSPLRERYIVLFKTEVDYSEPENKMNYDK